MRRPLIVGEAPGQVVDLDGDVIVLDGKRPEYKELGARWDSKRGAYVLPATRMNAKAIVDAFPDETDLSGRLARRYEPVRDDRLYDFQRDVAGRLCASEHGDLVCLSPGLGKTAIAIRAADEAVPSWERVVVVAPASLLKTWEREIRRWTTLRNEPDDVYVVTGKLDYGAATDARWIVCSWEKFVREAQAWGRGWPLLILDESVKTKSRSSKTFRSLQKLRPSFDRVWLLSGNPTTRYADDLWAQLHLIWPKAFPSYWRFADRYCVVEETPWGKKIAGTRANRDAAADNSDLVVVLNQEDVHALPEYLFETVDVTLAGKQKREYERMQKEFIAELSDGSAVIAQNEVARLQKLQQIASYWDGESAKHDALIELLPTFEGPHLVWTHWKEGAQALTARLNDGLDWSSAVARHVSGDTPPKLRDQLLEGFKHGMYDVLVLSLGVGKFGHTLTNAKTVHYVDKTWSADDYFQSLRRVRRIGLKHRPVVVTYRAPGTADEIVEANLEGKLGGISRLTKSRLKELLNGLGKESA